jgi:putative N6-adenine-specific DNA methylase
MPNKPPRRPLGSSSASRPAGERSPGETRTERSVQPGGERGRMHSDRPRGPGGPARDAGGAGYPSRPAQRGPAPDGYAPRSAPRSGPRPEDRASSGAPVLAANRPSALYLSCPSGVESLLAEEAERILGDRALIVASRGGIEVQPPATASAPKIRQEALIHYAMQLNLESRLAQRVLWRVGSRVYRHEDDIYHLARSVNWGDWITPQHTLRVDAISRRSHLQSLNFVALRVKDAVCDDLRERTGERPSVDTRFPDLGLVLYLDDMEATLYVDTSGEALFKRGWREDTGEAPLKETLAAAMLAAAGWQGRPEDGALLDPCCGAGTIPIEAAQIACGIAPGLLRRFAFEKLLPFRPFQSAWKAMWEAARDRQHPPQVAIYAGDVSFRMTDFATRNAERAGVLHAIQFKTADALQRPVPCDKGVLMFNPPYGERIDTKGSVRNAYRARTELADEAEDAGEDSGGVDAGMARPGAHGVRVGREQFIRSEDAEGASGPSGDAHDDAATFFQRLSSHWKKQYTGWTAWILSPDMKLPSAMRLKESRRVVLFNGPIECRLFRFDLVAGSNKRVPAALPADDASAASPDSEPTSEA